MGIIFNFGAHVFIAVERNTIDLPVCLTYPVAVLNSLTRSSSGPVGTPFLWGPWGFTVKMLMSSVNRLLNSSASLHAFYFLFLTHCAGWDVQQRRARAARTRLPTARGSVVLAVGVCGKHSWTT